MVLDSTKSSQLMIIQIFFKKIFITTLDEINLAITKPIHRCQFGFVTLHTTRNTVTWSIHSIMGPILSTLSRFTHSPRAVDMKF